MSVLLRLSLVLLLFASGISLGAARGQARVAGLVVLCAGGAVVAQPVDERGQPVGRLHVCPDMALSLMAAVGQPAPDVELRSGEAWRLDPVPEPVPVPGRTVADARARGPPKLT